MKTKTRKKITWGLSLLFPLLTTVCYTVNCFQQGFIPVSEKIILFANGAENLAGLPSDITLPYILVKLMVIVAVFVCTYLLTKYVLYLVEPRTKYEKVHDDYYFGTISGIGYGFMAAMLAFSPEMYNLGVAIALGIGLILGIRYAFGYSRKDTHISGIAFSIFLGITFGIVYGQHFGWIPIFQLTIAASFFTAIGYEFGRVLRGIIPSLIRKPGNLFDKFVDY